jgi:glutathione S-transferase
VSLNEGWAELASRFAPVSEGPYFMGQCFSAFECAVLPWFQRLSSVLSTYRDYELPEGEPFDRLRAWYAACLARPSFASTIANRERLVANYIGYADNRATSDCAVTTRATVGIEK